MVTQLGDETGGQWAVAFDVDQGTIVTDQVKGDIDVFQGMAPQWLGIPWRDLAENSSLDSLLYWQSELTELIGREAEMQRLRDWANAPDSLSVMVLTGEGGVGKSRLSFDFARQLQAQSWQAGQWSDPENPTAFRCGEKGTLLIVDDVEERHHTIDRLLATLKCMPEPEHRLRILFLTRIQAYSQIIAERMGILADDSIELSPFTCAENSGWHLFTVAWQRMRATKKLPEQSLPLEKPDYLDWQDKHRLHQFPLFILAYALNLIDDPGTIALNGPDLIRRLVSREEDRLRHESHAHGLHPEALVLPKALAAITGGLTARQLAALSRSPAFDGILPSYETLCACADTVPHYGDEKILPALQPDIFAAGFLSQVLVRSGNQSGQWQCEALAIAEHPAVATSRLGRLVHDATALLELHWPMDALVDAVKDDPAHCRLLEQGLSRPELERPLIPLAIEVFKSLANRVDDPAERARHLNILSNHLTESGDRAASLAAIQRAVEIREQLAKANFVAYGPELAPSLSTLSNRLTECGDRATGLEAIRRAVEIHEWLAEVDFEFYGPGLGRSLNSLSNSLAESGDRAEGLATVRRAVDIDEQLAESNLEANGHNLVRNLNTLSDRLAESGEREEGLTAVRRAVAIGVQLIEVNFTAFGPDLARSLNTLSDRLAESGDRSGSLNAIRRAVTIGEQLIEVNFTALALDLALSLNTLSNRLAEIGEWALALGAIRRAVEIHEQLAESNLTVYGPDLALSLNTLSNRLAESGDRAGSLEAISRALKIYEKLAEPSSTANGTD